MEELLQFPNGQLRSFTKAALISSASQVFQDMRDSHGNLLHWWFQNKNHYTSGSIDSIFGGGAHFLPRIRPHEEIRVNEGLDFFRVIDLTDDQSVDLSNEDIDYVIDLTNDNSYDDMDLTN